MQPVKILIEMLLLPVSNNSFENTFPDQSFYNSTRMFIHNLNNLTRFRKTFDFRYALNSSASVNPEITGNIWRKSPLPESSNRQTSFDCFVYLSSFGLILPVFFRTITNKTKKELLKSIVRIVCCGREFVQIYLAFTSIFSRIFQLSGKPFKFFCVKTLFRL